MFILFKEKHNKSKNETEKEIFIANNNNKKQNEHKRIIL